MALLQKIEESLTRYILRIDNQQRYSRILKFKKQQASSVEELEKVVNHYSKRLENFPESEFIECEVSYVNLEKAALNPFDYILFMGDNKVVFFDIEHFKTLFLEDLLSYFHEYENLYSYDSSYTLPLLKFRHLLPDKIISIQRENLSQRFSLGIKNFQRNEEEYYWNRVSTIFYDQNIYLCCNLLGANYFEGQILEFYHLLIDQKDNYPLNLLKFEKVIQVFQPVSIYGIVGFQKAKKKSQIVREEVSVQLSKERKLADLKNETQSYKSPRETNYLLIVPIVIIFGFIVLKSTLQGWQKKETLDNVQLPKMPNLNFTVFFGLNIQNIFYNQYQRLDFEKFTDCSFQIGSTQFKNSFIETERFKEIQLSNQSKKDAIVIWANQKGLNYSFLSSNTSSIKIKPAAKWIKLYVGNKPENKCSSKEENSSNCQFRFGIFTKADSILLTKDFKLEEISSSSHHFIIHDNNESVGIKSQ